MSDEPKYPDPSIPALFSDGVQSMSHGPSVVKFYLARFDSDIMARGDAATTTVAQVIMPIGAFIQAALFFDNRLEMLIKNGHITAEEVDRVRSEQRHEAQDAPASN